ncbi:MAG: glycosyltransferase family 2 protein [Verrucomicrobia bacterium]|nr:glycosyltransferase family 2 protein [Verrucomicrobiota bacterium]MCH8514415.1 glycosyltransferase family 2 protein [Kiritimatiellia bacterium]
MAELLSQSILLIPAFNEEEALPPLLVEIREHCPGLKVVVINDASQDRTCEVARAGGAVVLDLPVNLGVAGAMQAGFRWAVQHGYRYAIRCDSDGQHPPAGIHKLVAHMEETGVDLVIGSRALCENSFSNSLARRIGIGYLSVFLSFICRHKVTDPTSGFQMVNHLLMYYFAHEYPSDYPEPESLALLRRQGYTFSEVGVPFRARTAGTSSLHGFSSLYFAVKVTFALMIDRARSVDQAYSRSKLEAKGL